MQSSKDDFIRLREQEVQRLTGSAERMLCVQWAYELWQQEKKKSSPPDPPSSNT